MSYYKLFRIVDGKFADCEAVFAASTDKAVSEAQRRTNGAAAELWKGNVKVATIAEDDLQRVVAA